MNKKTENKLPWQMYFDEFFELSKKGRLHDDTGDPSPYKIGSQETPLSLGESEDYPYEDIAFFYIARRMPVKIKKTWPIEARKPEWLTENLDRIEMAYYEFIEDSLFEGKLIPSKILKNLKR